MSGQEEGSLRKGSGRTGVVICGALVLSLAHGSMGVSAVRADSRKYTFVYESTTMPKGEFEYEQWITWKTDKGSDPGFDRIDFRHEFEMGITEDFQLAVYASDWRYEDGSSVSDDGTQWRDVAFEGIYNLTNPVTDVIGSALYGEIKIGDELFEIEGKIIAEKYFGLMNVTYKATIEAEWEGSNFEQDNGAFEQALGVSYEFMPQYSFGAELTHEIEFPDWSSQGDDVVYLGPNVSWRHEKVWATMTPMWQITDVDSEANFQIRLIFGIEF